jgi:hypothetical protein
VSEQQSEPTSAATGSVSASDVKTEPVMTESPAIAPDQELTAPTADASKAEAEIEPRIEPKIEPKVEAPKVEAPKVEVKAEKAEAPRPAGNVTIMSPGERRWTGADAKASKPAAPKRRVAAMVAVVGFAAVAGAIGGALATSDLRQGHATEPTARNVGIDAAVARIEADILALKASVEQNARIGVTQFNKTSDRLDKVEKAQTEPATRLARLSDEVSKLRTAQAPAAAPVHAAAAPAAPAPAPAQLAAAPAVSAVPKDVTGSVPPPPAAAQETAPKVEVARLPTVEGWVLREVGRGSALIESRRGLFEVYAGDPIPGVGRVDAIRKQDGRWVVVTSKGLIVSR